MIRRVLLIGALFALVLAAVPVRGDGIRPVQIQITEQEPGLFVVHWKVPPQVVPTATPRPVLPSDCELVEEAAPTGEAGTRLSRRVYRCPGGLAGRTIGVEYPIFTPGLTALIRVELLSGERHVHALGALETSWQVPAAPVGAWAAALADLRAGTLVGVRHVLTRWVHLALVLVLALVSGTGGVIRLVTAFTAGQLTGFAGATLLGGPLPVATAEICVAVAVMFLAREASRPEDHRRRLAGIAAGAGLFHGVALGALPDASATAWWLPLALVVGMDAAMLLLAAALGTAARRLPGRLLSGAHYLPGAAACAAALVIALTPPGTDASARREIPLPAASTAAGQNAGRVVPAAVDAPVQLFLAVEPFEVRQEVLVRLRGFGADLVTGDAAEIEAQPALLAELAARVAARTEVSIDGQPAAVLVERANFVTSDPTGVLPRPRPVREALADALVGVTLIHPTAGMPQSVDLAWAGFTSPADTVPAAIVDPEASLSGTLSAAEPVLRWENRLLTDPTPTVDSVEVEPATVPVPLVSLVLLLVATLQLTVGLRQSRPAFAAAVARILLAAALIASTSAQLSLALPGSLGRNTSPAQARRVLAGLLPNVYRAFEVRDENAVHDRLALTVAGDILADLYLDQRQSLAMQARGGARARVEAVELLELDELEAEAGGGFSARASWAVGGTVTHFGHRHFRQNRYDARVRVVPVQGRWKIRALDVLGLERMR